MEPVTPPSNERLDRCRACGGACCRTRPGLEAPDRFLSAADPAGALAAALASGDWVLARHLGVPWVDGVPPPDEERWRELALPRPATAAEKAAGARRGGDEVSPCVFLGEQGCRLAFGARPRMCQALEPSGGEECPTSWDQLDAAQAWAPRQALVAEALGRLPPRRKR